jgi:hypothetical protein
MNHILDKLIARNLPSDAFLEIRTPVCRAAAPSSTRPRAIVRTATRAATRSLKRLRIKATA